MITVNLQVFALPLQDVLINCAVGVRIRSIENAREQVRIRRSRTQHQITGSEQFPVPFLCLLKLFQPGLPKLQQA